MRGLSAPGGAGMNALRRLRQAWVRNAGTVGFSHRTHDPATGAYEVVTYLAEPIPGSPDYAVTVRTEGTERHSEYRVVWSREQLLRERERLEGDAGGPEV